MSKDQRKFPRKAVDEPVKITTENKVYEGTIKDISKGGAAVEFRLSTEDGRGRFDIGNRVEMHPEKSEQKSARIIREYVSGMAVEFEKPDDEN